MKESKKEKRELREAKKALQQRTRDDRAREISTVVGKFSELGIGEELEGVREFFDIARRFVEDGIACSGRIKVVELGREIQYLLSNNKAHQIQVVLKNVE
jgi:endonuclease YncB( thermonuclease family)